jgi:HSP20 family molecular chaperone IbpA
MDSSATLERSNEAEGTRAGEFYRPAVDILEHPDELLVHADIPGTKSEDIEVNFEDGALTIHAKVKERLHGGREPLIREYGVGDFRRTFRVSEIIDGTRISASYRDGVLTLRLPKAEAAKPRKIQVNAG